MGSFTPQIAMQIDLQRFANEAGSAVWVVTRAQSGLMDVRCPPPGQDTLIPGAPVHICGGFSQPPSGWTMNATIEYAASELQPSEAQSGASPVIAGRAFKGTIVLHASYADSDVTLSIRLLSGSGATLGLDARRFQMSTISPGPTKSGTVTRLPAAVESTREAILSAARARNYSMLAPLIDPRGFQFSLGQQTGSAIAYWKRQGFEPLRIMEALLQMPFAIEHEGSIKLYVWPSALLMNKAELAHLMPELRKRFMTIYPDFIREMKRWLSAGTYTGWRLGIDSHGHWVFFVTND
jgi:hypothetical protein